MIDNANRFRELRKYIVAGDTFISRLRSGIDRRRAEYTGLIAVVTPANRVVAVWWHKQGKSPLYLGRVSIDHLGSWQVEHADTVNHRGDLPVNECLNLIRQSQKPKCKA